MNVPITFEQDIHLANELLELLTREQTHLIMMKIESIEAMLSEKAALLQKISVTAKNRYDMLASNHFEANEEGMLKWLKLQNNPEINSKWVGFQKVLNQAKEMNRLNGMLINKHFNRNQQLLNTLQGNSNADSVYGRDGQSKSHTFIRPTVKA